MGQSTRKNPDKLIAQLKGKLEAKNRYIDLIRTNRDREIARLKGEFWFNGIGSDDDFVIGGVGKDTAQKARLSQQVIVTGEIVAYLKDEEAITVRITDVSLKESL